MLKKLKENWHIIKENVRDEFEITSVSYNTWIEPLEVYDLKENNLVQIVFKGDDVDFAINYVSKRYSRFFQVMIEETIGLPCTVEFIKEPKESKDTLFKKEETVSSFDLIDNYRISNLNPKHTFDTFVVGKNNSFAHAASVAVAESPGKEYNPLFIYGGPGLGKTHLMHAIANFILKENKNIKIMYVTSEVFTNEVIDAIRNKNGVTMTEFRNKYRNIDVLLIDDIQFIIGKEATEEEFFNTFNFLRENGKQIVISSDKSPKSFTSLPERLLSRFLSGLQADISSPDYETRMAILRKKEEIEGYSIDNEILHYIATNIKTNIRELEGALTKMAAFSKLHPSTHLSLEIAKENLKDIINPEAEKKLTPDKIISVVAEHFSVSPEDIKSSKRNREILLPRQISMYLIRMTNDISLQEVGKIMNRDHSTVIHSFDKIDEEIKKNSSISDTIEVLKKKLIN